VPFVDRDDRHHANCLDLLETHPGPLIVDETERAPHPVDFGL
jgi:hypothetical protein